MAAPGFLFEVLLDAGMTGAEPEHPSEYHSSQALLEREGERGRGREKEREREGGSEGERGKVRERGMTEFFLEREAR